MDKNGSGPNQLLAKIPVEAYKKVKCECGCNFFQQAYALMQYPGGLWSTKRVTNPVPVMVCWHCGKAYDEKTAILIDLNQAKNG